MLTPNDLQLLQQMIETTIDKKLDARFAEQDKKLDERFAQQEKKLEKRFSVRFAQQEKKLDLKLSAHLGPMLDAIIQLQNDVIDIKAQIKYLPTRDEHSAEMLRVLGELQTVRETQELQSDHKDRLEDHEARIRKLEICKDKCRH